MAPKKTRKQEFAEAKAKAVDAEIIDEAVAIDATAKQVTLNDAIEAINKAFEAINSNSKTFTSLVDQDIRIIGQNVQLLINAINTLASENNDLKAGK